MRCWRRWIAPQNPYDLAQVDILDSRLPPGSMGDRPAIRYWLGTDGAGRDLLSAMLYGLRISLLVGVDVVPDRDGDRRRGRPGRCLRRRAHREPASCGSSTCSCRFPAILMALMLIAVLGKGVDKIIIALVTVQWAYYARTVRGTALVERARSTWRRRAASGCRHARILFRHILPNCLPPLIVVATVQAAHAIALEATLSFLGVGLPQTEPSLGLLISNGFEYMLSGKYWISFFPGLVLLRPSSWPSIWSATSCATCSIRG